MRRLLVELGQREREGGHGRDDSTGSAYAAVIAGLSGQLGRQHRRVRRGAGGQERLELLAARHRVGVAERDQRADEAGLEEQVRGQVGAGAARAAEPAQQRANPTGSCGA
jgi:hypothetical protein